MSEPRGRDRLRELIDAVLDGVNGGGDQQGGNDVAGRRLDAMAREAYSSPWHFSRELTRSVGEPPVSLRRRVLLERAAWRIAGGGSVTEAAFEAGYDSVDGFSRAFARAYGHPPSATPSAVDGSARPSDPGRRGARPGAARHWLNAPNGIHFHPPTNLWVAQTARERTGMELTAHLVHHDVDDTRHLLEVAGRLEGEELRRPQMPGYRVLPWDSEDDSIAGVLENLVFTKEVWLASIEGADFPSRGDTAAPALVTSLAERHEAVAPRWLDVVADIDRRGAWGDTLIDALCDPPESFVLGSVVAHVLTYSAHRRQLVRHMFRTAGLGAVDGVDDGDPIQWLRGPTPSGPVPTVDGGRADLSAEEHR